MDNKAKQQYLRTGGIKCPYCKSEDIEGLHNDIKIKHGTVNQKIICQQCGKTWLDVYTLTDILLEN